VIKKVIAVMLHARRECLGGMPFTSEAWSTAFIVSICYEVLTDTN
jgi:hypothetical protein